LPILIAWLAGIADFAAEMLVLRSGRFGLGASAQASTLLLALALAGFGLGAALARRFYGARSFAWLRVGCAVLSSVAVLAPMRLAAAGGFWASAVAPAAAIASAFLFAIPAGASLPLLFVFARGGAFRAGLLTSANAFGSVLGAWIGGVFGPTRIGSLGCVLFIVAVQLAAAGAALVAPGSLSGDDPATPHPPARKADAVRLRWLRPGAGAWLAFSAGAATIALEGLFARLLPFFFLENSETAALLLAAALLGISAGAAGSGLLLQRFSAAHVAGWAVGALVISGLMAVCILEVLTRQTWLFAPAGAGDYWFNRAFVAGVFIVPPLVAAGALSPAAFALAEGASRDRASRIHGAYAAGALVPAFLVPLMLTFGVSSTALVGAVGIFAIPAGLSLYGLRALPLLLPVVTGACLGSSNLTTRVPPFRTKPALEVLEAREGPIGLAAAVLDRRRHEKTLFTNAFRAAATGDENRYTRSLAHIPMMLAADEPKRAAIIAVGTGSTASAAARYKSLSRIELVEISGDVFELLHWFSPASDALFEATRPPAAASQPAGRPALDPRVKIVMDDGRRFVARRGEPFEVIVLEPLLPDTPAAYPFYTLEFYQLARQRLTPGGVLAQWIPIHATEPRAFRALVATFAASFPHRALYLVGKSAILVGSGVPLQFNENRMKAANDDPLLSADLTRSGCASPGDLVAQCVLGSDGMAAFPDSAILRDDVAAIERNGYISPAVSSRYEKENLETLLRARDAAAAELLPPMGVLAEGEQAARRGAGTAYLKARLALAALDGGSLPNEGLQLFAGATAHPFAALDAARHAATRSYSQGMGQLAVNDVAKALPELEQAVWGLRDPSGIFGYAIALHRSGQPASAQLYGAVAWLLDPGSADVPVHYPAYGIDRWVEDSRTVAAAAAKITKSPPAIPWNLSTLAESLKSGDPAAAAAARAVVIRERDAWAFLVEITAQQALRASPDDVAAARLVAGYLKDPTLAAAIEKLDAARR
jgi:spermidine synthase